MAGKRVYRRRRRLKPWAVAVLVLILVGSLALLVNGCSGADAPAESEDQTDQQGGSDQQLDTTVPDESQNADQGTSTDSQTDGSTWCCTSGSTSLTDGSTGKCTFVSTVGTDGST